MLALCIIILVVLNELCLLVVISRVMPFHTNSGLEYWGVSKHVAGRSLIRTCIFILSSIY